MESLSIRFHNNFNIEVLDSFRHRFGAFANTSEFTKLKLDATPIHVKKKSYLVSFSTSDQLTEFSYSVRVPFSALDGQSSVETLRWLRKKSSKLCTLDIYLHGIGYSIYARRQSCQQAKNLQM